MKVTWTDNAREQLLNASFHIWENNPNVARTFFEKVLEQTKILQSYPLVGRIGRVKQTRELIITNEPYIVVYYPDEQITYILAVIHTSQKWPKKIPFE